MTTNRRPKHTDEMTYENGKWTARPRTVNDNVVDGPPKWPTTSLDLALSIANLIKLLFGKKKKPGG